MSDAIASIKEAIRQRVLCSANMADVPIFLDTEANLRGKIDRALSTKISAGDKVGIFGIVTVPTARDAFPTPEAPLVYTVAVQFHEDPFINRLTDENASTYNGTGKYAESLASEAYLLLKHFQFRSATPTNGEGCFVCLPSQNPVQYLKESLAKWTYQIKLDVQSLQQDYLGMVQPPAITVADGTATVTCGTAGASIYVSNDGTYPSAQAGAALYSAPFLAASGQRLLACAYLSSYIPSIVISYTV